MKKTRRTCPLPPQRGPRPCGARDTGKAPAPSLCHDYGYKSNHVLLQYVTIMIEIVMSHLHFMLDSVKYVTHPERVAKGTTLFTCISDPSAIPVTTRYFIIFQKRVLYPLENHKSYACMSVLMSSSI